MNTVSEHFVMLRGIKALIEIYSRGFNSEETQNNDFGERHDLHV